MRRNARIALSLLLLVVSCVEKDPSWKITWGTGGSGNVTPVTPSAPNPNEPTPDPVTPDEVIPTDVPLLDAFFQDFKTQDTAPFSLKLHNGRDDFRYFPGFPSLSEAGTDILMLRLDPGDAPAGCPALEAAGHTFYGSYSFRIRTPDLSRLKKSTDAVIELRLSGDDPKAGVSGIGMEWKLSEPSKMTVTSVAGTKDLQSSTSTAAMLTKSQDPSAKFQTCGWDWTPDYVRWWILNPTTNEKEAVGEISGDGEVPSLPAVLSLRVFHSEDSPEYPFETEIDNISYEPFQDCIQTWRDKYFDK